ncbi:MAG TPA: sigma-70 family RNA polymerase sigma factor [Polyangiales bacterium]|nr:sigma-70 family RNA polymerase sigma factor [Polyangiales bacterium]
MAERTESEVKATARERDTPTEHPPRLRQLFDENASFVWRSLRRLGVAEADVDDLLQEVFLVVYRRLDEYEERDRARAWLYSICRRVAQTQRRSVRRRREDLSGDMPERRSPPTQLVRVEEREALELGHRLLSALPEEQREVFVLYEIEHIPMQQVADALGCPLYTAYSRLRAGRAKILAELANERRKEEGV